MKMALALGSPSTMPSTMALASDAPWRRMPPPLAAGCQGGESLSCENYEDQYERAYEDTHEFDGKDDYEHTCMHNYKNDYETRTRTTTKTNVSMTSRTTTSPPTIASWSATGLGFYKEANTTTSTNTSTSARWTMRTTEGTATRLHASVQETLRQTQDLSIGPVVAAGLLTNSSKSLLRYTAHHHFLTAPHFLTFTVSNLLTVQARTHGHVCRCIHTDICNLRGSVLGHFLHELFQEAHQVLRNIPWPEPASRLRPRSGSNAMIVVFQDAFLRVDAVQGN